MIIGIYRQIKTSSSMKIESKLFIYLLGKKKELIDQRNFVKMASIFGPKLSQSLSFLFIMRIQNDILRLGLILL